MKKFRSKGRSPRGVRCSTSPKDRIMWDIGIVEVRDLWKPGLQVLANRSSTVVAEVLTTLVEDTTFINSDDYLVPSDKYDNRRARTCTRWLIKNCATWVRQLNKSERLTLLDKQELIEYANDLETASVVDAVHAMQSATWSLPKGGSNVRRSSMILAQQLGLRAVYRGALHHTEDIYRTAAFNTLALTLFSLPERVKDEDKLLLETVRAQVITLTNALAEEDDDGRTEDP